MRNFLLPVAAGLLLAAPAAAETTTRDLEVIGRALGFVENQSGSERVLAIVHDASSAGEAEALLTALSGGLRAGRVTLTGRLVSSAELSGLDGAHAAVLIGGAAGDPSIAQAINAAGILSVASDMGCVEAQGCVMGVQSAPSVRIVVNRANADAASVSFAAAFAMMIEEI
ncbi:hypothetical protein [Maricaulis sp.]|uniref:hypothetical protein n=1 Tax=Maricaulis sp. TaxID=1486257 RepID=UPI002625213A|nr:hypothetical protein [Maricaulis sp.]